ncbi:MAG TPA: prephenate dehydrogenase/arogenate dehydrogenase family protein, partial [Gammaproteobacteria bacterium]|nr:prephenate dehydrogenase/arogenate dehydrogenase family protein [Gammaproteobacteria bacterium]
PAHPIAGTEKSGVTASFDSLFENRCTIVTPTDVSSTSAINKVTRLWQAMGANVVSMTPEHHDQVLAATSHLPHILAFSLVDTLAHMQAHSEIFRFSAGGFRDFTRIASSDPGMWRDICLHNKSAILSVLKHFEQQIKILECAISEQDGAKIEKIFTHAKSARDTHIEPGS